MLIYSHWFIWNCWFSILCNSINNGFQFQVMSLCRSHSTMIRNPSVQRFRQNNNQIDQINDSTVTSGESTIISSMKLKLYSVVELGKTLFSPPYLKYIFLTCFVDFGLMFRCVFVINRTIFIYYFYLWLIFDYSYYTLMMWFPDLFERFGHFSQLHPEESAGVCEVSSIVTLEEDVSNYFLFYLF